MDAKFTRRRFLAAASAGAAYLALTNMVGSELLGRAPKVGRSRTPKVRALQTPLVSTLPNISSPPPDGLWTFRSRPDLSPPAVEVTKEARDTAPGYVFVAPEEDVAGQGGSMIVDDRGQVMWFRPLQGSHGRAMNLEVQSYRGEPVLTWIETVPGEYVIFDGSYREIARFGAANGYNRDHHEFLISPQDTALTTIYNTVPRDLSSLSGPRNGVEVQGIIQELDIETGEVLFEWKNIEHVGLNETYGKPGEDADYPGIDYFHINSIDVDHHDNLRAQPVRPQRSIL